MLYIDTGVPAAISGLSLTGGHPSSGYGGAISAGGNIVLDSVWISGSSAAKGGGIWGNYSLTLDNSTISGNTASARGGGAYVYNPTIVRNSTISGNTAPDGAGISTYDNTTFVDSTIAGNTASDDGGQIADHDCCGSYQLTLEDTIVAGSGTAPDIYLPSIAKTPIVSFSLVRNPSAAGVGTQPIPTDATDVTGLDPQLGPLALAGGPTPTMQPLPSSPVLDRGNAFGLTTDQRGLSRPFALPALSFVPPGGDRSDIGAVEIHALEVSGISPASGTEGMPVTITGGQFTGASGVLFGSRPATSFTVVNDTTIVATAPPQNGGTVDVRVITPSGETSTVAGDRFTFERFTATISKPHAKRSGETVKTGIRVSCPAGGFSCSGSFKATASMKHHKTKIASGSISLSAGHSKTLTFTLGKKAYNQLRSKGKLKITIQIKIADGNSIPTTVNRTITLHYRKPRKKH